MAKGTPLLFELKGNETRLCLANSQISQWKLEISSLENKEGNNLYK